MSRRRLLALAAALPAAALPAAALPAGCASGRSPADEAPSPVPAPTAPPPSPARRTSSAPVVTSGGGPVPFTAGAVMLGAYVDLRGRSLPASLALRRRQLGRDLGIVHRFFAWDDDLPSTVQVPDDSTLMISWRGTSYDVVTSGSTDRLIAAAARKLTRYGDPVLLRWGWDMNRDFYSWGGADNDRDTGGYVKAWRRLHRIFDDEGADNVSWVWSPHWRSRPDDAWNAAARYYPGDRYVDWVGVAGYDTDGESPAELFDGVYTAYSTRKPIMITEVAAMDRGGRTKADWITSLAAWVASRPAVGGVVWFDTDTHPSSTEKWRIDSDKSSLAAFQAMADDPAFGG